MLSAFTTNKSADRPAPARLPQATRECKLMRSIGREAHRVIGAGALLVSAGLLAGACGSSPSAATSMGGTIAVVAAENEYGSVAAQIGGKYVTVSSVESNPNTDPHTYEVSPAWPERSPRPTLVIQNGVGDDDYMTRVESRPQGGPQGDHVQHLLGLPDDTPNPHLWYDPRTMPAVADAWPRICRRSTRRSGLRSRRTREAFVASLKPVARCHRLVPGPATRGRRRRRPNRWPITCCRPWASTT